jgi:hypothetical protein
MLAIKLHKNPRPYLGYHSYMVPIMNWSVGERFLRNWLPVLNYDNRSGRNNKIHYISLVRIPPDTRLAISPDYAHFHFEYPPFREHGQENQYWCEADGIVSKAEYERQAPEKKNDYWLRPGREWYAKWKDPQPSDYKNGEKRIGMTRIVPEIVLGQTLSERHILWTKDFRLLYHGNKKNTRHTGRKAKHRPSRPRDWEVD